jgi:hypothetical protein
VHQNYSISIGGFGYALLNELNNEHLARDLRFEFYFGLIWTKIKYIFNCLIII